MALNTEAMIIPERPRAIRFLETITAHWERNGVKRSAEIQVLQLDDTDYKDFVSTFAQARLFIHPETPTLVWRGYIFTLVRYVPSDNAIPDLMQQVLTAVEN